MNEWQRIRKRSGWLGNGLIDWIEGDTAFLSVVFSWNLPAAYQRAVFLAAQGYRVRAGGPAVSYQSALFESPVLAKVAEIGFDGVNALAHHNERATFTSRGCPRKCGFCTVPVIEGDLVELSDWPVRPIICDNNLLACSRKHFDKVIDRLRAVPQVDFNQGLDARLLTTYHAGRLAELDLRCVRLAWDHTEAESLFRRGFERLIKAGIKPGKIRAYCLIGYEDTPKDALYRLETIWGLGAFPNPMRYQPLDAVQKNQYVAPGWTEPELKRYMRYWQNLRFTSPIPFKDFGYGGARPPRIPSEQTAMVFGNKT